MLLDEPFQGLDQMNIRKSKALIDTILKENHTMVFITHFDHEIPSCVNKRIILSN